MNVREKQIMYLLGCDANEVKLLFENLDSAFDLKNASDQELFEAVLKSRRKLQAEALIAEYEEMKAPDTAA